MAVYTTINDPSAYFQGLLYTGNDNSSQAQTNTGNSNLQPDWMWIKKTNNIRNTTNTDSSRGFNKRVETQTTSAETTTTNDVISAQSNGFTVGNNGSTGENGDTYVAWQWKANGGTTSSNTDGSITSTVQVNTTAGFSVVTWTSNGNAGQTIGHGLGVAPDMVILKNRSAVEAWQVYHQSIGAGKHLMLDRTNAAGANTNVWSNTSPTSTLFYVGANSFSSNNDGIVMYCFAEKQGYSKFDSYTGNNSTDGPFVYTGFKPSWLMIRRTDSTGSWLIWDTKRTPNNVTGTVLYANDSAAQETYSSYNLDFLSNGFKIRGTDVYTNASGGTYIYMAFAENPFTTSDGVPTTAR